VARRVRGGLSKQSAESVKRIKKFQKMERFLHGADVGFEKGAEEVVDGKIQKQADLHLKRGRVG